MLRGSLLVDIAGTELTPDDREILLHPLVSGLTLFTRNYVSPQQLQNLTAQINAVKPGILIAVDHEGGRVQRFRDGFTILPAAAEFGKLYDHAPEQALQLTHDAAWLLASELLGCGVDLSFAPVLDLQNLDSKVIGPRAFHKDPNIVAILGSVFISGMHEAGMAAVGKHFPGHGTVIADSHLETPIDTRDFETIANADLIPFAKLAAQLDGIMPAHVIYSAADSHAAGFSSFWLQKILRERLQFNGTIFSDDLNMQGAASGGDYAERFAAALTAGCNVGLLCNNRAGVVKVLSHSADVQADSSNIINLQGKFSFSLVELQASKRWQDTVRRLKSIPV